MNTVAIKFEASNTILEIPSQGEVSLDIGYQTIINQYIRSSLPTPYETENIIMIIEDEITRVYAQLPAITKLVSDNQQIKIIKNLLQSGDDITTAQVELLFNQFADIISGSPRPAYLPDSLQFIVVLIILRELLHHLNIAGIKVV